MYLVAEDVPAILPLAVRVLAPKSKIPFVNVNVPEIVVGLVKVTPLALLIVKLLAAVKAVPVICAELPL